VVPVASQTMADHRMYLPLAAVVTVVVVVAFVLGKRLLGNQSGFVLGWVTCGFVAVPLAVLTIQRNRDYISTLAIWQDTVAKCPNNPRGHCNLGIALGKAGRIEEAIAHLEDALRIKPDYPEAHFSLGNVFLKEGRVNDAIGHYEQALRSKPDHAQAHCNLGIALAQTGNIEEAIAHFEQALRIKPDYAEAHSNLGNALVQVGRVREAIGHYEQALRIKPDYAQAHCNLGIALAQTGNIEEAIAHYEQALRVNPDLAEAQLNLGAALVKLDKPNDAIRHYEQALQIRRNYPEALNALAWLLATRESAQGGDPVRAVALAQQACQLTNHQVAMYLDTLAAAYAAAGRFNDAIATAERAVDLARSGGRPRVAEEFESRLQLYRDGHAYRQPADVTQGTPDR
jgi:tetratricopeptide (TPR) repeat protein